MVGVSKPINSGDDPAGEHFLAVCSLIPGHVFELITVWVLQLPEWQKRNHLCHLIFQMEQDHAVETIYGRNA